MDSEQSISGKNLGNKANLPHENMLPQSIFENLTPQVEVESTVATAEDIALLKTNIEQKLFDHSVPSNQWAHIYYQELEKYPAARPYKNIFDEALRKAIENHKNVNLTWSAKVKAPLKSNNDPYEEVAIGDDARNLFRDIYGFIPTGHIEAIKEATAIRFNVSDSIGRQLRMAGLAQYEEKRGIPIIVVLPSDPESDFAIPHELQHLKNKLSATARNKVLISQLHHSAENRIDLDLREHIGQVGLERLQRRELDESGIDKAGKDEMLAMFTITEDPELLSDILAYSGKEARAALEVLLNLIKRKLTSTDRNSYFARYKAQYDPLLAEQQDYLKHVDKGIAAFGDVFILYQTLGMAEETPRMTINVLEQFPLLSWPAVVKLLKLRHQKRKDTESPKSATVTIDKPHSPSVEE